jgi:ABC-type bacteriocin/lantibiotic exporter with double-glycine peptidase domain
MSQPLVSMVPQRHAADCAVSCLSMLLSISYEDSLLAFGGHVPHVLRRGVYLTEIQKAAAKLGTTLRLRRRWDVDDDEGIVHIRFRSGDNHVVVLRAGLFFDTMFDVWEPSDYLKANRATTGPLLMLTEDE